MTLCAVLTGFEPAASTLTGWRHSKLLHRTLHHCVPPTGIRTRRRAEAHGVLCRRGPESLWDAPASAKATHDHGLADARRQQDDGLWWAGAGSNRRPSDFSAGRGVPRGPSASPAGTAHSSTTRRRPAQCVGAAATYRCPRLQSSPSGDGINDMLEYWFGPARTMSAPGWTAASVICSTSSAWRRH